MINEEICAECGLEQSEWRGDCGQGYRLAGEWFCCQDCAEGMNCLCAAETRSQGGRR